MKELYDQKVALIYEKLPSVSDYEKEDLLIPIDYTEMLLESRWDEHPQALEDWQRKYERVYFRKAYVDDICIGWEQEPY